jgi:hypothetical protein
LQLERQLKKALLAGTSAVVTSMKRVSLCGEGFSARSEDFWMMQAYCLQNRNRLPYIWMTPCTAMAGLPHNPMARFANAVYRARKTKR